MTTSEKVREPPPNRQRRVAERRGLVLRKSNRRDPLALDYGLFAILDGNTGNPVHPGRLASIYALTIEDVELYLQAP